MITATLATMPGREDAVKQAVESLRSQVDEVLVYDNGKEKDLGDAGKFAFEVEGYHLVCDDDLLYAEGYAETMIAGVEKYDRKAVVSLHGRRIRPPLNSYYRDRAKKYRCLGTVLEDAPVHVIGTGCMAYHTDLIRFSLDDFPQTHRNMADIHVSVLLQKKGIPRIALAHEKGIVEHLPINIKTTIHHRHFFKDALQTEKVNSVAW